MKVKIRLKNSFRVLSIVVTMIAIALAFHNCVPTASSGGASTSTATGTPPPGGGGVTPIPVCQYTSNPVPAILGIYSDVGLTAQVSSISYRIGMGTDAGNEATRTLYVRANSGDSYSSVISVDCDGGNNVTTNCGINNGNLRIQINPANDAECVTGSTTVRVTVTDSVTAQGCQNLSATSSVVNLGINFTNGCYPTQRVNPTVPNTAGQMGASVAIDGNWAVAAVPGDDLGGNDAGAANVMFFNGSSWSQVDRLVPNSTGSGAFLSAVAISGNLMVLGAPLYNNATGRAWVYQFNGTNWVQVATLNSPSPTANERFGTSVSVSGGIVAVGAPHNSAMGTQAGAVFLFSGSGFATVESVFPYIDAGVSGDVLANGKFGSSLQISGTSLIVGAPFPSTATSRSEAVYLYRQNTTFTGVQKMVSADGGSSKRFGTSVALSGNNLIIGAPFYSSNNNSQVGRAYVYNRTSAAANFTLVRNLNPADAGTIDHFGQSVAATASSFYVGAPDKTFDQAAKVGAVYIYNSAGTQTFKVRSYRADRDNDSFGVSIGVANGWMISGAFNDEFDPNFLNSGSVYMVDVP